MSFSLKETEKPLFESKGFIKKVSLDKSVNVFWFTRKVKWNEKCIFLCRSLGDRNTIIKRYLIKYELIKDENITNDDMSMHELVWLETLEKDIILFEKYKDIFDLYIEPYNEWHYRHYNSRTIDGCMIEYFPLPSELKDTHIIIYKIDNNMPRWELIKKK